MNLIYEEKIVHTEYKFYSGLDYEMIKNHSDKGLDGIMCIFVNNWDVELKKINRKLKLDNILDGEINECIDNINNPHILIYQCGKIEHKTMLQTILKKLILDSYSS